MKDHTSSYMMGANKRLAFWKPMAVVGPGAIEIRIHRDGEWRVIYAARFRGAVYVLHAFEKKTRRTRKSDISLAQARYREACEREKAS